MGVVWRWGAITGGLVVLVDLIAAMLSSGQPDTNPRVQAAQIIDLLVNLTLYSVCGYRVGLLTRVVRSAAEAGVTAGVIAGVALAVTNQFVPPPLGNPPLSPAGGLALDVAVSGLALNVAMGGLLSFGFGFMGSRLPATRA